MSKPAAVYAAWGKEDAESDRPNFVTAGRMGEVNESATWSDGEKKEYCKSYDETIRAMMIREQDLRDSHQATSGNKE